MKVKLENVCKDLAYVSSMKLMFLFLLIIPIFSLKCSNCKHFMIGKPDIFCFGKCSLFPKTKDIYSTNDKKETVKTKTIEDRYYCSTARQYAHMCGVEGKFYEPN